MNFKMFVILLIQFSVLCYILCAQTTPIIFYNTQVLFGGGGGVQNLEPPPEFATVIENPPCGKFTFYQVPLVESTPVECSPCGKFSS